LVKKPSIPPVPRNWKSDGYLQSVPIDPWGETYQYMNDSEKLKIFSYGPKGKEGGSEVGNWNMDGESDAG